MTGILAAGRPAPVSRTWQVIGGFASVAVEDIVSGGSRCWVSAVMRVWGAEGGMRGCLWERGGGLEGAGKYVETGG